MAIPVPCHANLEVRMNRRGKLEVYWKGDRLPVVNTNIDHDRGAYATVRLEFSGAHVKLATDQDDGTGSASGDPMVEHH